MTRLLFVCALCGCGSTAVPATLDDLAKPAYAEQTMGIDTSATVALDGNGTVWTLSIVAPRPSSGFVRGRDATRAERSRIAAAFAALPGAGCDTPMPRTVFVETSTGGDRSFTACGDGGTLSPPYFEADQALGAVR